MAEIILHGWFRGVKVKARVWDVFKPDDVREVEVLVDTGAIYSVLPSSLLKSMSVSVIGVRRFRLANNQVVEGGGCYWH
jgi:predicted aspartyl protease